VLRSRGPTVLQVVGIAALEGLMLRMRVFEAIKLGETV
jgi:hypothetical protein